MSPKFAGGRRSIAVVFAAIMITTVACGTEKGFDVEGVQLQAPAAIKEAPFHSSADAEERKRSKQESRKTTVPGKRVPDARP